MFKNLKRLMAEKNLSVQNLQDLLGVSEKTIRNKLAGVTEFTWSEIKKIKAIFPEYDISYLFYKSEEEVPKTKNPAWGAGLMSCYK